MSEAAALTTDSRAEERAFREVFVEMAVCLGDIAEVIGLSREIEHETLTARVADLVRVRDAAEEFIHTGGTWSHNELVKALDARSATPAVPPADSPGGGS